MFVLFLKRLQQQLHSEEESLSDAHEVILEEHKKFKPSHIIRTVQGHFVRVAFGEEPESDRYGPARETWQSPAAKSTALHVLDTEVDIAGNGKDTGLVSFTSTREANEAKTQAHLSTHDDSDSTEDAGMSCSRPCP